MTLAEFIKKAQDLIEHGQDPNAELLAWDADIEEWAPITELALKPAHIRIYTDEG